MPHIGEVRFEDDSIWDGSRWVSRYEQKEGWRAMSGLGSGLQGMLGNQNPYANMASGGAGYEQQKHLAQILNEQIAHKAIAVGIGAGAKTMFEPEADPVLLLLGPKA